MNPMEDLAPSVLESISDLVSSEVEEERQGVLDEMTLVDIVHFYGTYVYETTKRLPCPHEGISLIIGIPRDALPSSGDIRRLVIAIDNLEDEPFYIHVNHHATKRLVQTFIVSANRVDGYLLSLGDRPLDCPAFVLATFMAEDFEYYGTIKDLLMTRKGVDTSERAVLAFCLEFAPNFLRRGW